MVAGVIILASVGLLISVFGFLIWKKEKINLLHDYHYDKVKEKDKKAFCTLSGIGVLLVGAGLLITAVILAFTESLLSYIAFGSCFIAGVTLLIIAGKYNR